MPTKLEAYIGVLQNILVDIPPEHRHTAQVEITFVPNYGDYAVKTVIGYTRPETDEEIAERTKAAIRATRASEERERALFEKLKAKYQP